MTAERDYVPGVSQHDRAVEHRDLALELLEEPGTAALIVALTHAVLALEARVEELTELMPR